MKTLHIDGDTLPYMVGFASQRTVYILDVEGEHTCSPLLVTRHKRKVNKFVAAYPDILTTELFFVEDPLQAINTLRLNIQNIVRNSGCETFKVILSGPTNFRTKIATIKPYKANREGTDKPVHFDMLREWLKDKPYTTITEDEEADDMLSRALMDGHMVASCDKDLNNTPGLHFNFMKGEIYNVTPFEATRNFYTQTLVGDTADNIPGINGIGPAKAAKILAGATEAIDMERQIAPYYEKQYGERWLSAFKEVGQLLWMSRIQGELWTPHIRSIEHA